MAKIAVMLADGFEEIEGLTVVDICRRCGIETDTVSITGNLKVTGSHRIPVLADLLYEEASLDAYDCIVLPGGMPGTLNLEAYEPLMEVLDSRNREGRDIAAICAAPSIFGHRGYLKGHRACCFPSFESHLDGAEVSTEPAVTSGHIITGRGMGAAIPFGLELAAKYVGREKADEMAVTIVYK